jgi:hypothetical protein
MKKYLVITIDVEPDCTPNWTYSSPLAFKGVETGIANRLQPLFNRYNIVPSYLINNVVLEDRQSIEVFKNLKGKFELGTHLHPEFMEPEKKFTDYAGKKGEANGCFYEPEIEFEKIKNITTLFTEQFGYSPVIFRAGRFSAGNNTIRSLVQLNYKVDTSVTPNVRWDDRTREHPVDFRHAPTQPYCVNGSSIINEEPMGKLLEVPVTITRKRLNAAQYLKYLRRNKRIPFKGSRPVWLRPVFSSVEDFKNILEQTERENGDEDVVVYNMMFHNVEVMPGLNPYTKTEQDCELYLQSLEWLFRYCQEHDIESVALSSLYDLFTEKK